jgi:hypothetical protein
MFLALWIDAQGDDEAFLAEVLAVNQQRHQIPWHRPLHQLLQFSGCGRLPLPAHTGFVDAVAGQTIVDGGGVVARRDLMGQFASHGPLHPAVLLKGLVTLKPDLPAVPGPHSRFGDGDFTSGIDDVPRLAAMPVSALLTVRTAALLNFLLQEMVDDL